MQCRHVVPALAAALVVMAGCSPAATSPNTPSTPPAGPSTTAAAPLSLVVIGDSIPYNSQEDCPGCRGFVTRYAAALGAATGREVTTRNESTHTGLTLPDLIQDLPDLQRDLSAADAIIVGIAHNSFPLNEDDPCGSPVDDVSGTIRDWSKVGTACARAATRKYRPLYDELFSTVAGGRAGKPTILLALNRYNDWIGFEQANLTPEQEDRTVVLHDAWNAMLCDSAEANGFDCTDVYHAFNGADGSTASGDLLAADYTHPSQSGNDEIAHLLTQRGFAPLL
jgi:lysophospholipase L1-like esterase